MRSTKAGCASRRSAIMRSMKTAPSRRPTNGDTTMKITIRVMPDHTRTLGPALVSAAPAKAPISACHALDHVGDVLTAVDRVLEVVVDLLPLDHVDGVRAVVEQPCHGAAKQPIALVLEAVHLGAVRDQRGAVAQVAEAPDGVANGLHGLHQHLG